jgi:oligopeptide/dipeptide ABC transporter ATP-binding protein
MFRGRIVEQGETGRVLAEPCHPYTRALIACIPRLGAKQERLPVIDHAELAALEAAAD